MDIPLFDRLRQLNLPAREYVVSGSGPLAIRGIIPLAHDLDVICREEVWNIARQIGRVDYLPEYYVSVVTMADGALTFGRQWGIGNKVADAGIKDVWIHMGQENPRGARAGARPGNERPDRDLRGYVRQKRAELPFHPQVDHEAGRQVLTAAGRTGLVLNRL